MTRKVSRLAMVGLLGGALLVPLEGCDSGGGGSSGKPVIDVTSKPKAPAAPGTHKLEPVKRK